MHFKRKQGFRHLPSLFVPIVLAPCSEFLFCELISTLCTPSLCLYPLNTHLLNPSKASASHSPLGFCWQPQDAAHQLGGYPGMQWIHYPVGEKPRYYVFSALNMFSFFATLCFRSKVFIFSTMKSNTAFRIKIDKSISYWKFKKETCI